MLNLLDVSDMNRRLDWQRRRAMARRALSVAVVCLVAVGLGVIIGRMAMCL